MTYKIGTFGFILSFDDKDSFNDMDEFISQCPPEHEKDLIIALNDAVDDGDFRHEIIHWLGEYWNSIITSRNTEDLAHSFDIVRVADLLDVEAKRITDQSNNNTPIRLSVDEYLELKKAHLELTAISDFMAKTWDQYDCRLEDYEYENGLPLDETISELRNKILAAMEQSNA